jgi:hypothetical protein
LRKTQSNSATLNCGALKRIKTACARDLAHGQSARCHTTPYAQAEAGPRPVICVPRSSALVHDVGGPLARSCGASPSAGPRHLLAPLATRGHTSPPPPLPMPRPHTTTRSLGTQGNTTYAFTCLQKPAASSSHAVRTCQSRALGRHCCRRCRTPVPLVFSSSILPRLCRRSHPRLLLRSSRNSPEQQPPAAAAAASHRRAHLSALFLLQVSS